MEGGGCGWADGFGGEGLEGLEELGGELHQWV